MTSISGCSCSARGTRANLAAGRDARSDCRRSTIEDGTGSFSRCPAVLLPDPPERRFAARIQGTSMSKPRVIIADDHTMLVEAFEKLLSPECDVIAKVPDGRALLAAVDELHPDVVVLDLSMPLLNGLDAARQIKQSHPTVRLVFVTMNEDPDLAAQAFRMGGAAYLLKRSAG